MESFLRRDPVAAFILDPVALMRATGRLSNRYFAFMAHVTMAHLINGSFTDFVCYLWRDFDFKSHLVVGDLECAKR